MKSIKEIMKQIEEDKQAFLSKLEEEALQKWSKFINLCKGLDKKYHESYMFALENQRLHNESIYDDYKYEIQSFKRISIPMISRIFRHLQEKNIEVKSAIRFEAKAHKTDLLFLEQQSLEERFRPAWHMNLDKEAQRCIDMAEKIADVIANRTFAPEFYFLGITLDTDGKIAIYYDDK